MSVVLERSACIEIIRADVTYSDDACSLRFNQTMLFLEQARSSNGQAVLRVQRSSDSGSSNQARETTIGSNNIELDTDGLPIVDCDQPAPWSTPPQKTFKQVRISLCRMTRKCLVFFVHIIAATPWHFLAFRSLFVVVAYFQSGDG